MAGFSSLKKHIPLAAAAFSILTLEALDLKLQKDGKHELGGLSGLALRNMGHPQQPHSRHENLNLGHPDNNQDLSALKTPAGRRTFTDQ